MMNDKQKLYDVIDEDGEVYLSGLTFNEAQAETDGFNDPEGRLQIAEHMPETTKKDGDE